MKKRIATILSLFAVVMMTSCESDISNSEGSGSFNSNGASKALFSVSPSRQVRFSKGNLQYNAASKKWRFAPNQFDYIGADNANIGANYDGWIDLFGWGTSGWNSGAAAYQPWSAGQSGGEYTPGGASSNDLTGNYARADWGVYNAISNGGNKSGMWRTLTQEEWVYLLSRPQRATKAYIENVCCGILVLPDNFKMPEGMSLDFVSTAGWVNRLTMDQWKTFEEAGAIMLPAAGYRLDKYVSTSTNVSNAVGYYWSTTHDPDLHDMARLVQWSYDNFTSSRNYRFCGASVRLVCDK